MLDVNLRPGVKKKVLLFGLYTVAGQAIYKKLRQNKNFKLYICYIHEKEKELIKDKDVTVFRINDIDKFLQFHGYAKDKIDYLIYDMHILKKEINEQDYQNVLTIKYMNNGFLDLIITKFIADKKETKVINISNVDVFSEKEIKATYNELSPHDPLDINGKTRSIGEPKYNKCVNLRGDIIGKNIFRYQELLEDIIQIENDSEIACNTNEAWNGLTSLEYASIIENIILNDVEISNIQHVFSQEVKLLDLYKSINKVFNKNLIIKEVDGPEKGKILTTVNPELQKNLWPKQRENLETALQELKCFYEE